MLILRKLLKASMAAFAFNFSGYKPDYKLFVYMTL